MVRKVSILLGTIVVVGIIGVGTRSCILWLQQNPLANFLQPPIDDEAQHRVEVNRAVWLAQPYPISAWATHVNELVVVDHIAYFATEESGIQLVDVSDPANLHGLRTIEMRRYVDYIEWHNGVLYATAGCTEGALYSIDVKNPKEPVPLDVKSLTCGGQFQIRGEQLYHPNLYTGLLIVDISNPASIQKLGEIGINIPYTEPQSSHPSNTHIQDARSVALYDKFAFLATEGDQGYKQFIIDVSNPTAPFIYAEKDEPATYGWSRYYPFGDYLYVLMDTGLTVNKFSQLGTTSPVSFYESSPQRQGDLYLSGERAYLLSGDHGMEILDISDPGHIRQLGVYTDDLKEPSAVWVENHLAYIADRVTGLHIIDVKDPKEPKALSKIK